MGATSKSSSSRKRATKKSNTPPKTEEPAKSARYYGHVAVFEVLEGGNYRLVAGGTDESDVQFVDSAAAETWIKENGGAEQARTLQVGRLFVDKCFTVRSETVTETKTVLL